MLVRNPVRRSFRSRFRQNIIGRGLPFEHLEDRLNLAGDVAACVEAGTEPTSAHAQAVNAINCLGFDLYEKMREVEGNLFFSPTSVSTVLSMLYAGTGGDTATQLAEAIHLGDEGVHDSFRALISTLERETTHELSQANAIWPTDQLELGADIVEQIARDYDGTTQPLDYSQPEAKDTINEWVEDRTAGRIKDLIKELGDDTVMTLTNAIYFKALWESPLDPNHTSVQRFVKSDGTSVEVPMMSAPQGFLNHTNIDGFDVIELPYEGRDASMIIMVPSAGHSAEELTPETLAEAVAWDTRDSKTCVDLSMPKFNTTVETDLKPMLAELGMPMAGDFSKYGASIVSQVKHKAFIEVNEQGTEAAAATFVTLILCFAKGTPVLTPDGEKLIEELREGDLVLARNEHSVDAAVEPKRIEEVFENRGTVISMRVGGQTIRTTPEHRFFEKDRGWTAAEELKPGDQLSLAEQGKWETVAEVDTIGEEAEVYNFRVADHHTYFVGSEEWGFALWTHNCYADLEVNANQPFHYFIRDNATDAMLFLGRVSDPSPSQNAFTSSRRVAEPPLGDTDNDLDVDFTDFLVLSENYGKQVTPFPFDNFSPSKFGDFNNDFVVNFADFLILQENFGREYEQVFG